MIFCLYSFYLNISFEKGAVRSFKGFLGVLRGLDRCTRLNNSLRRRLGRGILNTKRIIYMQLNHNCAEEEMTAVYHMTDEAIEKLLKSPIAQALQKHFISYNDIFYTNPLNTEKTL